MSALSIKFTQDQERFLREFVQTSFIEQVFTDCTLYCWAEDRTVSSQKKYCTFKCHRLILSAYSDFFRQCFLEAAKNSVPSLFLDIEPRTLENILRLIYFGQIDIVQSDIELFFNAATKLSLKDFKIANSNDVFNVDADQNHLKRRLTGDEPSPLTSKTLKNSRTVEHKSVTDSSKDKGHKSSAPNESSGEEKHEREDSLLSRIHNPSEKSHHGADIGLVSSSVSRLSAPPALSSAPSEDTSPPEGTTGAFTCTICNKQYSYKISLNKHMKSAHSN